MGYAPQSAHNQNSNKTQTYETYNGRGNDKAKVVKNFRQKLSNNNQERNAQAVDG